MDKLLDKNNCVLAINGFVLFGPKVCHLPASASIQSKCLKVQLFTFGFVFFDYSAISTTDYNFS